MAEYIERAKVDHIFMTTRGQNDTTIGIYEQILDIPTEDVAPVIHEKWVDGVCPRCGYDAGIDAFSGEAKYCAGCGAKMGW